MIGHKMHHVNKHHPKITVPHALIFFYIPTIRLVHKIPLHDLLTAAISSLFTALHKSILTVIFSSPNSPPTKFYGSAMIYNLSTYLLHPPIYKSDTWVTLHTIQINNPCLICTTKPGPIKVNFTLLSTFLYLTSFMQRQSIEFSLY